MSIDEILGTLNIIVSEKNATTRQDRRNKTSKQFTISLKNMRHRLTIADVCMNEEGRKIVKDRQVIKDFRKARRRKTKTKKQAELIVLANKQFFMDEA